MIGPEHYREAEKLLHIAAQTANTKLAADCQQGAQVHAMLALAAATALVTPEPGTYRPGEDQAWWEVAGVGSPEAQSDGVR